MRRIGASGPDDDGVSAECRCGPYDAAYIAGILDAIERDDGPWFAGRLLEGAELITYDGEVTLRRSRL